MLTNRKIIPVCKYLHSLIYSRAYCGVSLKTSLQLRLKEANNLAEKVSLASYKNKNIV